MADRIPLEGLSKQFRVKPGRSVDLTKIPTRQDGGWSKSDAREAIDGLYQRLSDRQEMLAADGKHALVVVLQAMDAGGKDSSIRKLSTGLSVAEAIVTSFKAPTEEELRHSFLWRIHQRIPPRGKIGIFNRSHYEDVIVVRVKELVPLDMVEERYDMINQFERMLERSNVTFLKFFLHISKDFQKERLLERINNPAKQWKLSPSDLVERKRWDEYQRAFEIAIERCNTKSSPWFVVPAERRWFRDLVITQTVVETLEAMKLQFPPLKVDPKTIVLD